MPTPSIRTLTGTDATGAGDLLLANADKVAAPPAGSAADASYVALFASLLARAQVVQANLVVGVATVTTAEAAHESKVAAARAEEKVLDAGCSAIHSRLVAEIKARTVGAQEIFDLLFPGGLVPLTKPIGRSQLALYQALLQVLASASATSNPGYALIADKVAVFRAGVESFARTIQEKERLDSDLTAARAARDAAQGEWTAAFRALLEMAAHMHGADSLAFCGWVRPILDWKANQEAARTRRANAAVTSTETTT